MIKIAFIAPYPELLHVARDVFTEQKDATCQVCELTGVGFDFVKTLTLQADVVVARGITAAACRHYFSDIPVVELQVSGYDVVRAIDKIRHLNCRQVAVMGSRNMIYGAETLSQAMGISIKTFLIEQEQQAKAVIEKIKNSGIRTVIGGAMTCQMAAEHGFNTSVIESGKEAVWTALQEAKLLARVRQKEQERTQQFKTILDYANEGIVAVDRHCQITLFNEAAAKLTGVRAKDALGQSIDNLLSHLDMPGVMAAGIPELRELMNVGRTQVMANCAPILVGEQVVGGVVTFQDVTRIQQLETRIREKIYNRGHVARFTFSDILGNSKTLGQCIKTAQQFSQVDSNVLIYGSTGTGKEVFAQSIHNAGNRAQGPFVALNCGALPENLLESELFGYVEGAFTGAVKGGKPGVFELAHGGTIFLDEISETSLHLQARLLRVLQEKEVRRIGDHRVIPIDVRVIAATNRFLPDLVGQGRFRKDLYYRLNVLYLSLPDLKERSEDIALLLGFFLDLYRNKFNKGRVQVTPEALSLLQQYDWPGNIRELQNIAERLAVQLSGMRIQTADVYAVLPELRGGRGGSPAVSLAMSSNIEELELHTINKVLRETNFSKNEAARRLGISRTTLWRKLKEMGGM